MIKHILVCLNNIREDDNTLQTAAKFARSNDARLIGLYIMANSVINSYHVYEHYTAGLRQQIVDEQKNKHSFLSRDFLLLLQA